MFLKVKHSPEELPEDFPLNEQQVEAVRFMDSRYESCYDLLNDVSYELAQYQHYAETLKKRLEKYEKVEDITIIPHQRDEIKLL